MSLTVIRRHQSRAVRASIAGALWLVALSTFVPNANAGAPKSTLYRGGFTEQGDSALTLRVRTLESGKREVVFRPLRLRLSCDDGTQPQAEFLQKLNGTFHSRTNFSGEFAVRTEAGRTLFMRYQGKLEPGGRAEGTFIYIDDPYDPPSDPAPAECTSSGPQAWTATRSMTATPAYAGFVDRAQTRMPVLGGAGWRPQIRQENRIRRPDYEGHFDAGFPEQSEISITLQPNKGRRGSVLFTAKGIPFGCEDGATHRYDVGPARVDFVNQRTFYDDFYLASTNDPATLIVIKGTLSNTGGRASGYVVATRSTSEPPDPADPDQIDCTSLGRNDWFAKRVGRDRPCQLAARRPGSDPSAC